MSEGGVALKIHFLFLSKVYNFPVQCLSPPFVFLINKDFVFEKQQINYKGITSNFNTELVNKDYAFETQQINYKGITNNFNTGLVDKHYAFETQQ